MGVNITPAWLISKVRFRGDVPKIAGGGRMESRRGKVGRGWTITFSARWRCRRAGRRARALSMSAGQHHRRAAARRGTGGLEPEAGVAPRAPR